jgi:hypothetical protein
LVAAGPFGPEERRHKSCAGTGNHGGRPANLRAGEDAASPGPHSQHGDWKWHVLKHGLRVAWRECVRGMQYERTRIACFVILVYIVCIYALGIYGDNSTSLPDMLLRGTERKVQSKYKRLRRGSRRSPHFSCEGGLRQGAQGIAYYLGEELGGRAAGGKRKSQTDSGKTHTRR